MNRRDAVLSLAAAAAAVPSLVLAADKPKPAAPAAPAPAVAAPFAAAIEAARNCQATGDACFELALTLLKKGDQSMVECADTTRAMLAVCAAFTELAVAGSPHTKALAAVCAKVCRDCEKSCRKHELHHAECRACGESCAKCAGECEKLAA